MSELGKLNALWRDCVRKEFAHTCAVCQKFDRGHDPHHIIKRGNLSWRHTISNGVALCRECHNAVEEHKIDLDLHLRWRSLQYEVFTLPYEAIKSRPRLSHQRERDLLTGFFHFPGFLVDYVNYLHQIVGTIPEFEGYSHPHLL